MKITFNTGREYTAEGQVITAELTEDASADTSMDRCEGEGVVVFNDHSRCIAGCITHMYDYFYEGTPSPARLQDFVMNAYDRGQYSDSSLARKLQR